MTERAKTAANLRIAGGPQRQKARPRMLQAASTTIESGLATIG